MLLFSGLRELNRRRSRGERLQRGERLRRLEANWSTIWRSRASPPSPDVERLHLSAGFRERGDRGRALVLGDSFSGSNVILPGLLLGINETQFLAGFFAGFLTLIIKVYYISCEVDVLKGVNRTLGAAAGAGKLEEAADNSVVGHPSVRVTCVAQHALYFESVTPPSQPTHCFLFVVPQQIRTLTRLTDLAWEQLALVGGLVHGVPPELSRSLPAGYRWHQVFGLLVIAPQNDGGAAAAYSVRGGRRVHV